MATLSLEQINAADQPGFIALLDGCYEHSPWVAERACGSGPFKTLAQLKQALAQAVSQASEAEQLALIRAHPELAGKAMVAKTLTAESTGEQGRAGLTDCSPEEFAEIQALNADYNRRFGWPFILAVRGPRGTGLSRTQIIETFRRRSHSSKDAEFAESLRNIHRIAEIRLAEKFNQPPLLGQQVWDWAEALARHTEHSDPGLLTCTYLTPTHQVCAADLAGWMREAGFDTVEIDAVGNVVGRFNAAPDVQDLRWLMTGSHYDTVRNGGKYDGRLGILVAIAAVRELKSKGQRLPFGLELVAFAEEEGQRYKATFLGSSALVGQFNPAWLDQVDADGVPMSQAMRAAGLPGTLAAIQALQRDASQYLAFVEVHIEQGPVLCELGLPLGVVTSINGSARYLGEVRGEASHAGTTPMNRRRDAATAVAELALYAESRAASDEDSVATIGLLEVPNGSINVVPGRCRFSLDIRAPHNAQRNALVADVKTQAARMAERRRVTLTLEETMVASAAPSAPNWQARWEDAVSALGLPLHRLPSGAGHDAMKLHELLPQAMLFVRGENGGISHNPLESTTCDDMQLAVEALLHLLGALAHDIRSTQGTP